ncbi:MAG: tetratricopeptide repeat protein [Deltaproteobacteria bacterium]|nr:tetratricopeptide repeat protein [Deltaproteobacteria bacterium]
MRALLLIALVSLAAAGHAQPQSEIGKVERLIDDGQFAAAENELEKDGWSKPLRTRFRALIALRQGQLQRAARLFEEALRMSPGEPNLSIYLAHVYLESDRAKDSIRVLAQAKPAPTKILARPLLKARAEQRTGDDAGAYSTLVQAHRDFPREPLPVLELCALSARLSLRAEARRWASKLVARKQLGRDTALALVHSIYTDPEAAALLEALAARFPDDPQIRAHLAYGYAATKHHYVAGSLFEAATGLGGEYAFEAADQYRLAGMTRAGLAMNSKVRPAKRRLLQRMGLLFSAGALARVTAMEASLQAAGVLDTDARYRLAYAHYRLGNTETATRHARKLLSTDMARPARSLLQVMGRRAEPAR